MYEIIKSEIKNINELYLLKDLYLNQEFEDKKRLKEVFDELITFNSVENVLGILSKDVVLSKIKEIQYLIENKSVDTENEIDNMLYVLNNVFTTIGIDLYKIGINSYQFSEEQANIFERVVNKKNVNKDEILSKIFLDLKTNVNSKVESVVDNIFFNGNEDENKAIYDKVFINKKYNESLNGYDVFFNYLQNTYEPSVMNEIMTKFIIYAKSKNLEYDLFSEKVFDDELNINSLLNLRSSYLDYINTGNSSTFFENLIKRIQSIHIPAKLKLNETKDISSAKITFNNTMPQNYTNGVYNITPAGFLDYCVKDRNVTDNNKTEKNLMFGRIMAIEPINDIFNHQSQYLKENNAFNDLIKKGYQIKVFESQKPVLLKKLQKRVVNVTEKELEEIGGIFDNLINCARNKIEKPEFELLQVQIGKNIYNVDNLENVYLMTNKLFDYLSKESLKTSDNLVNGLLRKTISWINICLSYEIDDKNLNLLYSENFRDNLYEVYEKVNNDEILKNDLINLYLNLNENNRQFNKEKALLRLEEKEQEKKKEYWKNLNYGDRIEDDITAINNLLNVKNDLLKLIGNMQVIFSEANLITSYKNKKNKKIDNIKIKYDDKLKMNINSSITVNGKRVYHSMPEFTAKYKHEILFENVLLVRNKLLLNDIGIKDVDLLKEKVILVKDFFRYLEDNLLNCFNMNTKKLHYLFNKQVFIECKRNVNNTSENIINYINNIQEEISKNKNIEDFNKLKSENIQECEEELKKLKSMMKDFLNKKVNVNRSSH